MDGVIFLWILLAGAGLCVQYLVIRTAVHQGMARFLRDVSRQSDMREGYDIPRRIDRLAVHLADITRRPPPAGPE